MSELRDIIKEIHLIIYTPSVGWTAKKKMKMPSSTIEMTHISLCA